MNLEESDTIANQRKLLRRMALKKGFSVAELEEYIDDGHTGTNFDRPSFKKLLADVETGKIKAILVKDFSRMGRDYIGVGEFVEQYFPARGVRIISINDNWDSDEHIGETMELDTTFRTMIYDMYSKDLSVKRRTANKARNKNGIFIGGFTIYGYKKIPGDTHSIVVDEKAAPIVKRVFQMFLDGDRPGVIARILNDEGIDAPAKVKRDQYGVEETSRSKLFRGNLWTAQAIGLMLRNEIYTGTLILNKTETKGIGTHNYLWHSKDEWLRFPNNHEAIIPRETFDLVQKKLSKNKEGTKKAKTVYSMPLYCGHCGKKLKGSTRNEKTYMCGTGEMIPFMPCGQIQVRRDRMQEVLVKAVNTQAKVFLNELKRSRVTSRDIHRMEKQKQALEKEKQGYRDQRIKLYEKFKAGLLEQDEFLRKKREVLKLEEECLNEYETLCNEITEKQKQLEKLQIGEDKYKEYALLKSYDFDVVHHLISKVECFNDGHIKIHWNFKAEFRDAEPLEESYEVSPEAYKEREEQSAGTEISAYTSDLWLMPHEVDIENTRRKIEKFCSDHFGAGQYHVTWFHDSKDDEGVFFREGYMKFIDTARREAAKVLIIDSFEDLYLSHYGLQDLLKLIIPKMKCRFISIKDGFDSASADDAQYQKIYEEYKGTRRSDIILYRAEERRTGKRVAAEIRHPQCTYYFGYHVKEDGCYADPWAQELVKEIFQKTLETGKLIETAKWLNEKGIPTIREYTAAERGEQLKTTKNIRKWDGEKVWRITKQKIYVEPCRHCRRCQELGYHCDIRPLVDREIFDAVNAKCQYRKDR